MDVAVIGGGISGLATAYNLKSRGCSVVVLERQTLPGGNAFSQRMGGFLMEHGPSTVNAAAAIAVETSRALGLDDQRCDLGEGVRRRYLVAEGRLAGISTGPLGFLASGYLSPLARLRMLAEFAFPHQLGGEEETALAFCSRRFGREFAERVMDPLVAGIYAGRASELSVLAIFPKLVALERIYGSVSLGLMHRRREGGKMPSSRLFSWREGIAALPRALTRRLGGSVRTGIAVRRVRREADGFRIDAGKDGVFGARAVVMATQPHVAAQLLDGLDDTAAAAAGEIEAPPLAVVFLGFKRNQVDHPLDGLGFLTAEVEGRNINGAQFSSTMFPGRAPEGYVSVSGYFGGARAPDLARLADEDLIQLARNEFSDLIGARGQPVVARVRHWPVGLPQYGIRHVERTACLRDTPLRQPGLFLTGNYFNGPSVGACLGMAGETATAVDRYVAGCRGLSEKVSLAVG